MRVVTEANGFWKAGIKLRRRGTIFCGTLIITSSGEERNRIIYAARRTKHAAAAPVTLLDVKPRIVPWVVFAPFVDQLAVFIHRSQELK